MAFTIAKMLLLKEFEGCKLVAGADGVDRVIEFVDTMEIPNIGPWIKKNEILLTTGYSIMNRMDLLMSVLDALYKNGSAGLAIKTRFIGPLPKEVIARANAYKLPIIEMADETPFIPLLHAIGNCIADEQHSMLLFSLSVAQHFNNLPHTRKYFQEICRLIHSYIDLPVVITDYLLIPYDSYPEMSPIPQLQDNAKIQLIHQELTKLDNLNFLEKQYPDQPVLLLQKVHIQSILAAYIFIPLPEDASREIQEQWRFVLAQAATSLAQYLSDSNVRSNHYWQEDSSLYQKLLSEKKLESGILNHWIRQYSWPPAPVYLLTFHTVGLLPHTGSDSINFQISWIIRSFLFNDNIPCTIVPREEGIRCIIPAIPRKTLMSSLTRIIQKLRTDLGVDPLITVSSPLPSYLDLPAAHAESFHAQKIAEKTDLRIAFSQDLSFELALLQGADSSYLRRFADDTLGKLIEYDQQNNSHLLQTLQELVNHMGVHTQTANALYLHRNTLLYRIRRIESLTGLDLSSSDDLYRANTALRIRKLLQL